MLPSAHDTYLETQVRTATPQRLRLMLIDGALRFAHRAEEAWGNESEREAAYIALVRCRQIVSELFGSIKQDQLPVAREVASIYLFLFRCLAEIPLSGDPAGIRDVIEVLESERETWRQVCETMPQAPEQDGRVPLGCREITASDGHAIQPGLVGDRSSTAERSKSLSLEA